MRPLRASIALATVAVSGIAAALVLSPGAQAWTVQDAHDNGFNVSQVGTPQHAGAGLCMETFVYGHGSPYTDVGNTCDDSFQAALDGFMSQWCPCANVTTSTTATTDPATTQTVTTTVAPSQPPPDPPADTTTAAATTTVTAVLPAAPYADFSAASINPNVVAFTDESREGGAAISTRAWQFGDGGAATGPNIRHVYPGPGSYYVTLTVIDANGLASLAVHLLTITAAHAVELGPRQTQIVSSNASSRPPVKAHHAAAKLAKKKGSRRSVR